MGLFPDPFAVFARVVLWTLVFLVGCFGLMVLGAWLIIWSVA